MVQERPFSAPAPSARTKRGDETLRRIANAVALTLVTLALWAPGVRSQPTEAQEEEIKKLAQAAQNPVASMVSLPFQYNWNYGVGPERNTMGLMNIQPVYPVSVSKDWNLINRVILPIISMPQMSSSIPASSGIGDIVYSAFLSPKKAGKFIWGAGPVVNFPSATKTPELGSSQWGLGPTAVVLKMQDKWVYGALVNNIWGISGAGDEEKLNAMTLQYFVNYNMPKGFYVTSSPIITANWSADSDDVWTVPFGIGMGRVFLAGNQPMNVNIGAYYNAMRPTNGPEWQMRMQVQMMFPTH
jgi:hypothetical protein